MSEAVLHEAAGDQRTPALASNGEIALVAWHDKRDRFHERIYATRVDAAGNVLDPAGILLTNQGYSALGGVVWNGTHFAVAVIDNAAWVLVFIAPDGAVAGRRVLDLPTNYEWADASDGGAGVRMLFLTGGNPSAAIVDGDGDVFARDIHLLGGSDTGNKLVAGSRGSEFLVLLHARRAPSPAFRTVSIRIDGEQGRVISGRESMIPLDVHTRSAIEGGPAGWVVVAEEKNSNRLMVQRLDETGVAAGAPALLFEPPQASNSSPWPRMARDNGRFTVVWSSQQAGDPSFTWVAFVTDDGAVGQSRQLNESPGFGGLVNVASAGGLRLVVTTSTRSGYAMGLDLFAQKLTDALTATAPVSIAHSPLTQSYVSAAAGRNGYLAAWVERGPDPAIHLLVRRVLPDGTFQGLPLEAGRIDPNRFIVDVTVVSNGSRYLVAWQSGAELFGRRMEADTGAWIDAAPFAIGDGDYLAVASNGTDAVAAWRGDCSELCVQSRRIRLDGDPLADSVVTLVERAEPTDFAIASNGTDYLVVWAEGRDFCECPVLDPRQVLALRLRADATKLDASPLVLLGKDAMLLPGPPKVAWNGGRYLVATPVSLPEVKVEGTIVTAEGSILERRVPLVLGGPRDFPTPLLFAHRDEFVLFALESMTVLPSFERIARWTAVSFDADAPLEHVAALPRTVIANSANATLGAASSGLQLLVIYDRGTAPETGGVSRAYTRLFGGVGVGGRRRSVR